MDKILHKVGLEAHLPYKYSVFIILCAKIRPLIHSDGVLFGHVSLLDMAEKENVFEKQQKKSTSRARLMISSCCVLMEDLLKIFCRVRGVTPILSASHSFVWPCRRNSSRIREPICICMVVCYLCAMPPIPLFQRPQKGGEQFRLHTAVVGITIEEKMKCSP